MSPRCFPGVHRLVLALTVVACASAGNVQAQTVLNIAGEAVSAEDFSHIFKKNNRDSVITAESLDEYMELFIDFKLKVKAAEAPKHGPKRNNRRPGEVVNQNWEERREHDRGR